HELNQYETYLPFHVYSVDRHCTVSSQRRKWIAVSPAPKVAALDERRGQFTLSARKHLSAVSGKTLGNFGKNF
ncbi:MAG: hypothetical protein ACREYC_28930, partial [Gammaproteobacteria bacterium]